MSSQTFEEKLENILNIYSSDKEWARARAKHSDDYREHENACKVCNIMTQITDNAKKSINKLIEEDVVGEDYKLPYLLKNWDDETAKQYWYNLYRAEQRKIIKGE